MSLNTSLVQSDNGFEGVNSEAAIAEYLTELNANDATYSRSYEPLTSEEQSTQCSRTYPTTCATEMETTTETATETALARTCNGHRIPELGLVWRFGIALATAGFFAGVSIAMLFIGSG